MFDVSVPEHFQKLPIISIARKNGGVFIDGDWIESKDISDSGIRYLTTGNVGLGEFKEQGSGYITEDTFTKLRCTEVLPGDILVSRLNVPIGRACLVPDLGERMVTSVDNVIIRPCNEFNRKFLVYLFSTKHHIEMMNNLARGTTMLRVSRSALGRVRVQVPNYEEQTAIARFLDRETGLIDGLIEKKTRFIALLKEKRAAVITHAVTKGVDPEAPMKDSGVDWLGRVPAHWAVLRIAALFREVSRPADPALPVLSVSIHDGVTDGELADEDRDRKVALSEDRTKYQGVAPGDLVYNMMRAWQGAFGAVAVKGLVSPAYVVAAPVTSFRTKFIEHLLHTKSAAEEIRRFSRGIADFRMRLYWDHFRALKVCLPPLDEQDRILSEIDAETARIDGLITLTERSIDLLREKRSALITAAVTGKIDVRAAA
ncbi:restriction endonuclease subunit S [Pseudodonghicola flavimaris]|uniref:Restriction endonuclease subunit S n=1 Tax=Pseudodonghicola flavimaris TaxID=3050036 RepID=A0ABT7F423_9RHOB|nr:restriction endonuclease subunit S [Pseudodonghicola flavimaris]MDK3019348.1 restriction endonuclease subunit S [Pseudodonghicola flavimaris]